MLYAADKEPLDPDIVDRLRAMALQGTSPVEVLEYLSHVVKEKDDFVNYMMVAFRDDGDTWLVATRWWHGDISELAANAWLQEVFTTFVDLWK